MEEVLRAVDLTDGAYDAVEYARIRRIHSTLAKEFDISLNGAYGELARGHWWGPLVLGLGAAKPLDLARLGPRRFITDRFDASIVPEDERLDLLQHFRDEAARTNAGLEKLPNTLQMDNLYLLMRLQHWRGRISSSTQRIWPSIPIFSFRSVLETLLSVAPRDRVKGALAIRLMERLQPALARVPFDDGRPALPFAPRNFRAFLPVPFRRVKRMLVRTSVNARRSARSIRLELLALPEIAEVLRPSAMLLSSFLPSARIAQFLASEGSPAFVANGQWNRVLTIELALRRMKSLRSGFARRKSTTPCGVQGGTMGLPAHVDMQLVQRTDAASAPSRTTAVPVR